MRVKSAWLAGLLALCLTMLHAQAPAPSGPLPDAVAASFYQWYLDALGRHTVPTDDLQGPIGQRISSSLVVRLRRLLRNGDMEEDYFLKAQDFLPEWKSNVHAKSAQIMGSSATTEVTLGAGASEHKLKVSLVRQDHRWKIDAVRAVPAAKSP